MSKEELEKYLNCASVEEFKRELNKIAPSTESQIEWIEKNGFDLLRGLFQGKKQESELFDFLISLTGSMEIISKIQAGAF